MWLTFYSLVAYVLETVAVTAEHMGLHIRILQAVLY